MGSRAWDVLIEQVPATTQTANSARTELERAIEHVAWLQGAIVRMNHRLGLMEARILALEK